MRGYELQILLDSLEYTYLNEWEQTRIISYVIAQTHSTKHIKPSDIIKFEWDKEKEKDTKMTKKDVKRLKEKMNHIIELNKKQNK